MQQFELGRNPSTKRTHNRDLLARKQRAAPWAQLQASITPHSPQGRGGRPLSVRTVLRIDFILRQSPLGVPAMEEALHVAPMSREVAGMNNEARLPDESAILRTWRLRAENDCAPWIPAPAQREAAGHGLPRDQERADFGDSSLPGAGERPDGRRAVDLHIAERRTRRRGLPLERFALKTLWVVRKKQEILAGSARPEETIAA